MRNAVGVGLCATARIAWSLIALGLVLDKTHQTTPDLNPETGAFSKVEGILGRPRSRTKEALMEATSRALVAITSEDIRGFYSDCGYRLPVQSLENRSNTRSHSDEGGALQIAAPPSSRSVRTPEMLFPGALQTSSVLLDSAGGYVRALRRARTRLYANAGCAGSANPLSRYLGLLRLEQRDGNRNQLQNGADNVLPVLRANAL